MLQLLNNLTKFGVVSVNDIGGHSLLSAVGNNTDGARFFEVEILLATPTLTN
jgi:hypothetical protein